MEEAFAVSAHNGTLYAATTVLFKDSEHPVSGPLSLEGTTESLCDTPGTDAAFLRNGSEA